LEGFYHQIEIKIIPRRSGIEKYFRIEKYFKRSNIAKNIAKKRAGPEWQAKIESRLNE